MRLLLSVGGAKDGDPEALKGSFSCKESWHGALFAKLNLTVHVDVRLFPDGLVQVSVIHVQHHLIVLINRVKLDVSDDFEFLVIVLIIFGV